MISFNYENPISISRDRVNAVEIRIRKHINYGTSAYPVMILLALDQCAQTQEQIIHKISETWDTSIDRKAVGRHLQLLQNLGFPVQHGPDGYYYDGEKQAPKTGIKYSPSAYPLLILQVLGKTPQTKAGIIHAVQNQYGAKIDRKAVGRHLELLHALGYHIQERDDGYYIDKSNSAQDAAEKVIYLTFDAGYENGNVAKILDALKAENVPGAFFVLENLITRNPDLIRRMAAEGHLICNHTASHRDMTKVHTVEGFAAELSRLETVCMETTGVAAAKYYRPPEGRFSEENLQFAKELGCALTFGDELAAA